MEHYIHKIIQVAKISLISDLKEPSRWFSSLLFSLTTLILLGFVITTNIDTSSYQLEVGTCFIVLFFTLQTSLAKSFDMDLKDRSIDIFSLHKKDLTAVYLGKYFANSIFNTSLIIPIVFFSNVFLFRSKEISILNFDFMCIVFLLVSGSSALGCLLASLVYKSSSKESLFPLLFYPLLLPLLIFGIQGTIALIEKTSTDISCNNILLLLNIIYLGLGVLFFSESFKN